MLPVAQWIAEVHREGSTLEAQLAQAVPGGRLTEREVRALASALRDIAGSSPVPLSGGAPDRGVLRLPCVLLDLGDLARARAGIDLALPENRRPGKERPGEPSCRVGSWTAVMAPPVLNARALTPRPRPPPPSPSPHPSPDASTPALQAGPDGP